MAYDGHWREVGVGRFRLPHYCTVYQAEALAQREAVRWSKQQGGGWVAASDSRAVLGCLTGGRRMTKLVNEIVLEAGDQHSFMYIPGHQGHRGNERADELAGEAADEGVEVQVEMPRARTRRLAKDNTWRLWAQEWQRLRHEGGMDMGEDKAYYLRFAPAMEDIRDAVWKGGKARGRGSRHSVNAGRGWRTLSTTCFTARDGRRSGRR